jgi:hypothetical protein
MPSRLLNKGRRPCFALPSLKFIKVGQILVPHIVDITRDFEKYRSIRNEEIIMTNRTQSSSTNHLRRESRYFISTYGRVAFFQAQEELGQQEKLAQETMNPTTMNPIKMSTLSLKLKVLMNDLEFSEKDAYRFIQFTALSQLTQSSREEDSNGLRSLN